MTYPSQKGVPCGYTRISGAVRFGAPFPLFTGKNVAGLLKRGILGNAYTEGFTGFGSKNTGVIQNPADVAGLTKV